MSIYIETNKIIELSECNLESKALVTGTLLKWMDIIACLAAEKCANVPCVTATVDNLHIEETIRLNQVVSLTSKINRVFNTSMEVEVDVMTEDFQTREKNFICKAFFTFVTQHGPDGKKNYVPGFEPATEDEKVKFALANERKKMRIENRKLIKKIKEEGCSVEVPSTEIEDEKGEFVYHHQTMCECVEIVLPQHANHHATTFGGQLMAWMEATGTISARRLCVGQPRLLAVDEVFFMAPSKVGDRIVIKSMVNNTFDRSMEVGVRVEAYAVGGAVRHINSAHLTFVVPDEHGNPKPLPKMKATSKEDYCRMSLAVLRVKMRQESKHVVVCCYLLPDSPKYGDVCIYLFHAGTSRRRMILNDTEPIVSVTMTDKNQKILCYKNMIELMTLYNRPGFVFQFEMNSVRFTQLKIGDSLCIRLECDLDTPTDVVFDVLNDHTKRKIWDMCVVESTVCKVINENEDCVIHYVMQNMLPQQYTTCDDMVLLASSRKEERLSMIAYRSVSIEECPPVPEYQRVENRCSGFIIEPSTKIENGSKLTYVNQLTEQIYKYVKSDLKGATANLSQNAMALFELVKQGAMKQKSSL